MWADNVLGLTELALAALRTPLIVILPLCIVVMVRVRHYARLQRARVVAVVANMSFVVAVGLVVLRTLHIM